MQEILHVYDSGNREIVERDLEHEQGPLLFVLAADGGVTLAATAATGDEVLAAFVRDEDGWTFAAADPSRPIKSGAKSVQDLHLMAGLPCQIEGFTVRIERAVADTGSSLVWRFDGSPVAVDHVLGGRNEVTLGRETGFPEVNAASAGNPFFTFYQTAEGFEVATSENSADRISVSGQTLFSVEKFEGMFMTPGEAAAAIKTKNPFAWPSRFIRMRLELGCFALLALFVIGMFAQKRLMTLRAANTEYRGAVEMPATPKRADDGSRDDVLVYSLALFRTLPAVLTAKPNNATLDLIQRGTTLAADHGVAEKVAFLKDVRTIQETILSGRWEELRNALAAVNASTFVECDADNFLRDAREVAVTLTEELPKKIFDATSPGKRVEFDRLRKECEGNLGELADNIFLVGDVVRRERDVLTGRLVALAGYLAARDRVLSPKDGVGSKEIAALYDAYAELLGVIPPDATGFEEFNRRERGLLKGAVDREVAKVLAECGRDELGKATVVLNPLADLGELLEYPPEQIASWRTKAKVAAKKLDAFCRELYSEYRLKALSDRTAAEKLLKRLVEVGDVNSGFRKWAVKEMERIEKETRK